MDYGTMTIESLADDCFRKSGYKINKADLISRITHLCENHKSEVNVRISLFNEVYDKFVECKNDSEFTHYLNENTNEA
tara:strand:- start:21187 stop:21420 length:234 start_codon:yes stop_codon:yes gene_type:complete